MIIMHHEIGVQWQDLKQETKKIDFTVYGEPNGYSAMAATVGFPTGIATKMILDGEYYLCCTSIINTYDLPKS